MAALTAALPGCTLAQGGDTMPEPYRPARLPRPATLAKPAGTAFFAPDPPVYPIYPDLWIVEEEAHGYSLALEACVKAWLDGNARTELPDAFVPNGTNLRDYLGAFGWSGPTASRPKGNGRSAPPRFRCRRPGAIAGSFPIPPAPTSSAPLSSRRSGRSWRSKANSPARGSSTSQVTPSFDPRSYRYEAAGVGEVPIVDADIEPLPGHANPFRAGADWAEYRRGYRVEYELRMGDPVALNRAFRPPHFRARGNSRVGGAIMFRGPWRARAPGGDGRGRQRATAPEPVAAQGEGPDGGWYKQAGIFRAVVSGIARNTGRAGAPYVLRLDKGVAGRGSDLAPPRDYKQSATSAAYTDCLVRGMSCGRGSVVVLTGRLPTFPDTAKGGPMREAQMRYWSIVGYAVPEGFDFLNALSPDAVQGVAMHAVRDAKSSSTTSAIMRSRFRAPRIGPPMPKPKRA
jgi:hypothetical protein